MNRLVEALQVAQPTYRDLGGTLAGGRPEGFRHDSYEMDLGHGYEAFRRAGEGLNTSQSCRRG